MERIFLEAMHFQEIGTSWGRAGGVVDGRFAGCGSGLARLLSCPSAVAVPSGVGELPVGSRSAAGRFGVGAPVVGAGATADHVWTSAEPIERD